MDIKIHPEMVKRIEHLKGTPYTTSLSDEVITAFMKIKKCVEEKSSSSYMGAALFLKRVVSCYYNLTVEGQLCYNAHHDWYTVSYNSETFECDINNDKTYHIQFDPIVCISMGAEIRDDLEKFVSEQLQHISVFLWQIIKTEKFKKYFDNLNISWRDVNTWKKFPDKKSYKIDLTNEQDLDLCYLFENCFDYIETTAIIRGKSCDILNLSVVNKIEKLFISNKQYFCPICGSIEDAEISGSEYFDYWFKYQFNDQLSWQ